LINPSNKEALHPFQVHAQNRIIFIAKASYRGRRTERGHSRWDGATGDLGSPSWDLPGTAGDCHSPGNTWTATAAEEKGW